MQPQTQTHVEAQNHPLTHVKIEPKPAPLNAFNPVSVRLIERPGPAIILNYLSLTLPAL